MAHGRTTPTPDQVAPPEVDGYGHVVHSLTPPPGQDLNRVTLSSSPPPIHSTEGQTRLKTLLSLVPGTWSVKIHSFRLFDRKIQTVSKLCFRHFVSSTSRVANSVLINTARIQEVGVVNCCKITTKSIHIL